MTDQPPTEKATCDSVNVADDDKMIESDAFDKRSIQKRKEESMMQMKKDACTVWNEETQAFEFLPVCGTKIKDLGKFGVGLQLYFELLCFAGILFFLLGLITVPMMVINSLGNTVRNPASLSQYLAATSLGNIGYCKVGDCLTHEDMKIRPVSSSHDVKVSEVAEYYGILDAVAVLLFTTAGLWFLRFWIPRVVHIADTVHVTPADYAVQINGLPRKLADEHGQYRELLTRHVESVLAARGCDGSVAEVTLVRDYDGAVATFMVIGKLAVKLHEAQESLAFAESEINAVRIAKGRTKVERLEETIRRLQHCLKDQSRLRDVDREVVTAFVMFQTQEAKHAFMDEYSYAAFATFRLFQSKHLRFSDHRISVQQPCEPGDLNWENLDYSVSKRFIRKGIINLLTIILLIIFAFLLVVFQSMKASGVPNHPNSRVWVISSASHKGLSTIDQSCLKLCSVSLFSEQCTRVIGDTQGLEVSRIFNSAGDIDNVTNQTWNPSTCLSKPPMQSGYCKNLQDRPSGGNGTDWIAIEFSTAQVVKCATAEYPAMQNSFGGSVQFFSCRADVIPETVDDTWKPHDHCLPLQAVSYAGLKNPDNPMLASTPNLMIRHDTTCKTPIPYEAALAASEEGADNEISLLLRCFCQQQAEQQGYQFRFRSKTDAQKLCRKWSRSDLQKDAKLTGMVIAVLVLNQIHTFINGNFVEWERHLTITDMLQSRMVKTFFSLFVNSALLVLVVNLNLHDSGGALVFLRQMFNIGNGPYDDMSTDWYIAVGSSLFITFFTQIASTTTPGLVKSFIVNPLLVRFNARNAKSQKMLNHVYAYPEFDLATRIAQTLNVSFCIMMYSSTMPVLYFVGFIYCITAFWLDKWCLLRGCKKPASVNQRILVTALNLSVLAVLLHTVIAMWSFGNQRVLPSGYNDTLRGLLSWLLDMTEKQADEAKQTFLFATDDDKKKNWRSFASARMLDCSRTACVYVLIVFVGFVAVKLTELVSFLLLKPVFTTCKFLLCKVCCRCFPQTKGHEHEETLDEALAEWKICGLQSSYCMSDNPRFAKAYEAVMRPRVDGHDVLEADVQTSAGASKLIEVAV